MLTSIYSIVCSDPTPAIINANQQYWPGSGPTNLIYNGLMWNVQCQPGFWWPDGATYKSIICNSTQWTLPGPCTRMKKQLLIGSLIYIEFETRFLAHSLKSTMNFEFRCFQIIKLTIIFQLIIKEDPNPILINCGGTARNVSAGRVLYAYTGNYPDNVLCEWYLYADKESSSVSS